MKTLFFDCFAGASGDMILGALIALGVDENELLRQLKSLNFSGYEITFETVNRSGLSATKANVVTPYETKHRHLSHIVKIIDESGLSESIKKRSIEIFNVLGRAEAKMHGTTIEKVHFHEVGAMDAIIDIVGACIGFELLNVENFACSALHLGSGFVKMAHGKFPVPAPAVAEILKTKNAPTYQTEILGELVTPTGAAIIATVCDDFGAMPTLDVENIGYGAGTREYQDFPNVLRLIVGETDESKDKSQKSKVVELQLDSSFYDNETLILIETNIDDLSPQVLAFVQERAFDGGALDCWFEQIVMKKSRPATKICVLCERDDKEKFSQMLFDETTTLGVRCSEIERISLPREFVKVQTEYGEVTVKIAKTRDGKTKAQPEFEDCRKVALQNKVSLREIEATTQRAWRDSQSSASE